MNSLNKKLTASAKAIAAQFPDLYSLARSEHGFHHVVVKEYRKDSCTRYRGNAYIEALPALPSDETLGKALAWYLHADDALRLASKETRLEALEQVRLFVVAHPRNVRLLRNLLIMIRSGYAPRKPFSKLDNEDRQARYEGLLAGDWISPPRGAQRLERSIAIVGPGGVGKTFALVRAAELLPPVIYHPAIGQWQIPMLGFPMLPDDSVHTCASSLYQALNHRLPGQKHADMHRQNAFNRLSRGFDLLREYNLGALHLDEGQNTNKGQQSLEDESEAKHRSPDVRATRAAERPKDRAADFLIAASNTARIPFIVTGTFDMVQKMGAKFSAGRRLAGSGCEAWRAYDPPGTGTEEEEDLNDLLEVLFGFQVTRHTTKLTMQIKLLFSELTQGFADIAVKLFIACQEDAIVTGTERMTEEQIRRVFKANFVMVEGVLLALKAGDPTVLSKFPDLYAKNISRKRKAAQANA